MGLFVRRQDNGIAQGLYVLQQGVTKLIIGLGNTGDEFVQTRHNVGFAALDAFVDAHNGSWTHKKALKCTLAELRVGDTKVLCIKPTTMMNLSGEAASAIQRFYKVTNEHTLVISDDIDLEFGVVRTRVGGSSGGNNGIKSLITHIGESFSRVRIGVANEHRSRTEAADFVLAKFSKDEKNKLPEILQVANDKITLFITGEFSHATDKS